MATTVRGAEMEQYAHQLEVEVASLDGLKAIEDWYRRRSHEIWVPYHREVLRLTEAGVSVTAEMRDGIALRTGATAKSHELLRFYERATGEFMAGVADNLTAPGSPAQREVIERFDTAWRELANR
jgi:3-deoxy-D-arabino-heptulosonate 7-phosphate (DAHP) synthase class II